MDVIAAYPNGSVADYLNEEALRAVLNGHDRDVWIDILDPSPSYLKILSDFLDHPLNELQNCLIGRIRPKVDVQNQCYIVVWFTARYDVSASEIPAEPLVLVIGNHFLITLHNQPVPVIEETRIRWQEEHNMLECRTGTAVHTLLDAIIDDYYPVLDDVADSIDEIESDIFAQSDSDPIQKIFSFKKSLLQFRRIVAPERDVINILLRRDLTVFQPEDMPFIQDLYNRLVRMAETIDLYRDLLSSGLDSYVSMQSNRLNEIIKILTVTSIVLMTNSLIAGIYGMNFDFMPELHWTFGYPFALLLMLSLTSGLIYFFRRKHWI